MPNTTNRVYSVEEVHAKSSTPKLARCWDELMLTLMLKNYIKAHGHDDPDEQFVVRQLGRNTCAADL